jgi:hypothetical protein
MPNPPIPPPLNGNDALAILQEVWGWIEGVNDGNGFDADDLGHALTSKGYGPDWFEGS